jgi:hypothetical protein
MEKLLPPFLGARWLDALNESRDSVECLSCVADRIVERLPIALSSPSWFEITYSKRHASFISAYALDARVSMFSKSFREGSPF